MGKFYHFMSVTSNCVYSANESMHRLDLLVLYLVRRICKVWRKAMSDRASKAVIEASLPGEPRMYNTRSKRSGDPLITLYYRDYSRRSKEGKA